MYFLDKYPFSLIAGTLFVVTAPESSIIKLLSLSVRQNQNLHFRFHNKNGHYSCTFSICSRRKLQHGLLHSIRYFFSTFGHRLSPSIDFYYAPKTLSIIFTDQSIPHKTSSWKNGTQHQSSLYSSGCLSIEDFTN